MHKMVSRFLKGVNYGGATQTGDKIDLRMESGLALSEFFGIEKGVVPGSMNERG